jgi:hypothetical protein
MNFHFSISFSPAPIQLVSGVKRPGRVAEHSHPTIANVKKAWIYTSTSQYVFIEAVVEFKFTTDSRPVCLGVRRPSGTRDQFFFLLEISFRQLLLCYFVVPSLTRGRVCNFWAFPEQSHLGRSPADLRAIFYCLISDSPNLEGQVPLFISPRNRVAQLYSRSTPSCCSACLVKRMNNFTLDLQFLEVTCLAYW